MSGHEATGRLRQGENQRHMLYQESDGLMVAKAQPRPGYNAHAMARRIVACVNACEGIPDPERAIPAMREALCLAEEILEDGTPDEAVSPLEFSTRNALREAMELLRGKSSEESLP